MRACIASVLETDLEAVPHLTRTSEDRWFDVFFYFMYAYGYNYIGAWDDESGETPHEMGSIDGYFLAGVNSRNYPPEQGVGHLVVMDSDWVVIHDPHPSKSWQDENLENHPDLNHIWIFRELE